jgi:hypothetical protein
MGEVVGTDIPARLDRLPWSRWHWFVVVALGVTWILDGLEVTLAGFISGVLQKPEALSLTDAQVGMSATAESVKTALQAAALEGFDLLVSDIGLPDGDVRKQRLNQGVSAHPVLSVRSNPKRLRDCRGTAPQIFRKHSNPHRRG